MGAASAETQIALRQRRLPSALTIILRMSDCVFSSSAAMTCVITVRQVTPIVHRAMSFSSAMLAIWSVVGSIFLTPLGEAAACGLPLCCAGEARDGEGEATSMEVVRDCKTAC